MGGVWSGKQHFSLRQAGGLTPQEALAWMQSPAALSAQAGLSRSQGAGWPCLSTSAVLDVPNQCVDPSNSGGPEQPSTWVVGGSVSWLLGMTAPVLPSEGALEPGTRKCPAWGLVLRVPEDA